MSDGSNAAQLWFIAGTVPFLVAGGGHALLTLVDTVRPTYFAPEAPSLNPALEHTGIRFRRLVPGGDLSRPSMWRAWLGFNISHGLGVFAFALLALLVALEDPGLLVRADSIALLALAVSATYFVVALRFWFWLPVLITAASTSCFAIAALTAG
jgi:hypothetical protein